MDCRWTADQGGHLGENFFHGDTLAVLGRVKRTLLNLIHGLRANAHGGENRGVKIGDRHRLGGGDQRAFVGRRPVEETTLQPAAAAE